MHVCRTGAVVRSFVLLASSAALSLVGLSACVEPGEPGQRTAGLASPDDLDTVEPYLYPAVVRVRGGETCTGTLISPNHVLTAAHCVQSAADPSVTFGADDGAAVTVGVARCELYGPYVEANTGDLRPEYRGTPVASLGGRCGILERSDPGAIPAGDSVDLAVLQLVRPIPHEALDGDLAIAAGEVFEEPVLVVDDPSRLASPLDGVAVGFGGLGVRQYQFVPNLFFNDIGLNRDAVLVPGDSGGPLLVEGPTGPRVIAVATTTGGWASLARDKLTWVQGQLDRNGDGRADTACAGSPRGVHSNAAATTDADGDGYLDIEDSCPSTYNPCQDDGDLDDDGLPDDCDACPHDPLESGLRGRVVPDADGDGTPDTCDCQSTVAESYYAHDADGDFLMNSCDNCIAVYNPGQENADGDLRGDLCDGCPFTPRPSVRDIDEDDVPDACDNCVDDYNPLQANCNEDAERQTGTLDHAIGEPGVGDACDPIPCGETTLWNRDVPPPPGARRSTAMDEVRIEGLRVPEMAEPGYEAWTGTRFCRCTAAGADGLAARNGCVRVLLDGTGGCEIADVLAYDAINEHSRWRSTTVAYVPPEPTAHAPTVRYGAPRQEVLASYGPPESGRGHDALGHWYQDLDLARWASPPISDVIAFGPGTPMRGVFWTHTPGDASGPGGADRMFDAATRALASHYWSGPVAGPIDLPAPFSCFHWIGPFVGASPFCPSCSASFPAPWLGTPGNLGFGGECGRLWLPPMLRVPEGMIDPAPAFGGDPAELFGGVGGRWLSASEPDAWLPELGSRYVALAPDGLHVERVLVLRDDGLVADAIEPPPSPCDDPGGCPPSPCDNPQGCDPLPLPCTDPKGCFGTASLAAAVEPIDASVPPVAVFSARRRVVWVIAQDGTQGIRVIDLPTGAYRRAEVAGGVALGRVVAAAYSPASDQLLILDTVGDPPPRAGAGGGSGPGRVRLLRMAALGGALAVMADWPRAAHTDRFAMGTEPSGALWVAASGDHLPGHRVARIEVGGETAHVVGFRLGSGTLHSTVLRANRRGASFVVVDAVGRDELVGYEPRQLRPARPGDTQRWF